MIGTDEIEFINHVVNKILSEHGIVSTSVVIQSTEVTPVKTESDAPKVYSSES